MSGQYTPAEFARAHAKQLGEKTLRLIGEVLAKHDAGILEGVIEEVDQRARVIDALAAQNAELVKALEAELADMHEQRDTGLTRTNRDDRIARMSDTLSRARGSV